MANPDAGAAPRDEARGLARQRLTDFLWDLNLHPRQLDALYADVEVLAAAPRAEPDQALREAAVWVLNVESGIGKSGGPPEDEEYHAALDALKAAASRAPDGREP